MKKNLSLQKNTKSLLDLIPSRKTLGFAYAIYLIISALDITISNSIAQDEQTNSPMWRSVGNNVMAPKPEIILKREKISKQYEGKLPFPLIDWIAQDKFTLEKIQSGKFKWKMPKLWQNRTTKNFGRYKLTEELNIEGLSSHKHILPFGFSEQIDQEVNSKIKALKILWNSYFSQTSTRQIMYEGRLLWFNKKQLKRNAQFTYIRHNELFSNSTVKKNSKEEIQRPLYRETWLFSHPKNIANLSIISWRFTTKGDDLFWRYSPLTNSLRTVLQTNRGDSFLESQLSLDDLFAFSMKFDLVSARVLQERKMLIPIIDKSVYPLYSKMRTSLISHPKLKIKNKKTTENNEITSGFSLESRLSVKGNHPPIEQKGLPSFVNWNYNNSVKQNFFNAWNPLSSKFIEADMWIIEINPLDPLYENGRQLLFIEKQSMLPFYKITFGIDGSFKKLIMASWGLTKTYKGVNRYPFLGFCLGINNRGDVATAFETNAVHLKFSKENSRKLKTLLMPESYGDTRSQ